MFSFISTDIANFFITFNLKSCNVYIRIVGIFISLYQSIELTIAVENLNWEIFFL